MLYCSTLHYASPDILTEGEGYNGRLHDVWSAGVNLFVMVTVSLPPPLLPSFLLPSQSCWQQGELPFNDNNPKWLLRKIMSGSYSYPPGLDIPDDLKHLISQMLKVDSRERITVPDIKKHPWFNSIPFQSQTTQDINPEEPITEVDEEIVKALQLMNVGWDNLPDLRNHLRLSG